MLNPLVYYPAGPWRNYWARYGYNPYTSVEARFYQVLCIDKFSFMSDWAGSQNFIPLDLERDRPSPSLFSLLLE